MDIELAKKVAIEAVNGAGEILMAHFGKENGKHFKAEREMVTEIDFKSEKFMVDLIKKNFPGQAILSEESGLIEKESEYMWVMDPIDGTMNYYHGVEPFCVALCLLKNGEPMMSAVYNPVRDILYFAEKGKGATLNGQAMKVSKRGLKDSVVITHLSADKEAREWLISRLERIFSSVMQFRMFGSGISALSYIANGNADIFFGIKTHIWDILPGLLLIEEAGGKVTDIKGEKINLKSASVLATNGVAHEEILALLNIDN